MPAGLPPFQTLLDDHQDEVMRFLVASVGPVDADDCFQETFLSALRAYPRLRNGDNLRAWVLKIANRKAIDAYRGRRRSVPVAEPPDRRVAEERRDGRPELWSAVAGLPPKQRSAIALRYGCDLPYIQIGALIGCSEEAARRNVHEGVKRLREEWGDD